MDEHDGFESITESVQVIPLTPPRDVWLVFEDGVEQAQAIAMACLTRSTKYRAVRDRCDVKGPSGRTYKSESLERDGEGRLSGPSLVDRPVEVLWFYCPGMSAYADDDWYSDVYWSADHAHRVHVEKYVTAATKKAAP